MRQRWPILAVLGIFWTLASCGNEQGKAAVLWTGQPEFAVYGEYFNSMQDLHKVEVRYIDSPAQKLSQGDENPDIIVGNWLKSAAARTFFSPLDKLFTNETLNQDDFYPRLLALGKIENRQYLLPVSFNIPALVFVRDKGDLISNPFTIGLEEIKRLGMEYNQERGGVYSRIGFSPAWNDEFLFLTAKLFDSNFREASPLAWDSQALERAMVYNQTWIGEANTSFQQVDDFTFKYFYDPPAKLLLSGHILFIYMESAELFTMAQERRSALDFRWIEEDKTIPLNEDTVYYGISKRGKAKKAAEAFTRWFFTSETQMLLLESSRNMRMNESSFGIGGGFSALRSVTEQIFPRFYPSLVGHIPPEDYLAPPNVLPRNWPALKEKVILPYMHDRIRHNSREEISPLERRINDWTRLNRE
ncbi:MAG: extracellular solute-binding protein [Treponema sp.]|jgi:ABC-type glycerol-3-phosphate transport system substrate-binding protein|nr:extracellular solute-binding protein [Treponema sp.]